MLQCSLKGPHWKGGEGRGEMTPPELEEQPSTHSQGPPTPPQSLALSL